MPDSPRQEITHARRRAGIRRRNAPCRETITRSSRNDMQPVVPRKQRDDVRCNSFSGVLPARISIAAFEGQYCDACQANAAGSDCWACDRLSISQLHLHVADKLEAAVSCRSDEWLSIAGVADQLADSIDAAAHCCLGNDSARPDLLEKLVLRNHAIPMMLQQVTQDVEDLRLH